MLALVSELGPRVERALDLGAGSGARLLVSLAALLLGAEQSGTGPALAGLDLPGDVAEFMKLHTEMDLFRDDAPWIVAGVREASRAG